MKNYTVWSRVDESGAVTESIEGFDRGDYDDLKAAVRAADRMAGASVMRNSDGAEMMPDYTWAALEEDY